MGNRYEPDDDHRKLFEAVAKVEGIPVESILAWPDQRGLADLMFDSGWRGVGWKNLSGGIVALHRAHA